MSTRATIEFSCDGKSFFVYRHCDGFPEVVKPDIDAAIEKAKRRWPEEEVGCLVTLFLAMHYDPDKSRLPNYELSTGFAGDESYRYFVRWDRVNEKWCAICEHDDD